MPRAFPLPLLSVLTMTTTASISPAPASVGARRYRSKTVATWLAFLLGATGAHRFYLHGWRDGWGWACWPGLLAGLYGVLRFRQFGPDDLHASVCLPILGLLLAVTMLVAIVYGLEADEKWNARFNVGLEQHESGWPVVIGVILSLMVGAGVLMASIAYGSQHYIEYSIEEARKISQQN